jgi:chemotaxis protein MotB
VLTRASLMHTRGIREDQVTPVRGFADQRLRKPETLLDPPNLRISLIVQYLDKKPSPETAGGEKTKGVAGQGAKAGEAGEKKKE